LSRYLDLLWVPPSFSYWNFTLKNFYIWSSLYILILMLRIYPRTREREKAWRLALFCTAGSAIAAPIVTLIFKTFGIVEMLITFSLALESVCILPQLLLLRQTTVPTVITSFYLLTLGSYRFFYILNWIWRAAGEEHFFDPTSVIFGVIQTALYVDFAWVYWTRQRVKLRGGGVVDSDDLRKSWLVGGLLGRGSASADNGRPGLEEEEEEEEEDIERGHTRGGTGTPKTTGNGNTRKPAPSNRWGKRGVSVSADDTLEEHAQNTHSSRQQKNKPSPISATVSEGGTRQERTAILKQPDDFLDDDDDDNDPINETQPFSVGDADGDEDPITPPSTATPGPHHVVLNSGEAWNEATGGGRGSGSQR
jgi:ER lumen protein retaining receptor